MRHRLRPLEIAVVICGLGLALVGLVSLGAGRDQLTASDDGSTTSPSQPSSGQVSVAIVDFAFAPADLSVTAGSTITWTNDDAFAHSVVSDGDGPLVSDDLTEGRSYEHTFDQPGTYAYICGIHNSMTGTVTVVTP